MTDRAVAEELVRWEEACVSRREAVRIGFEVLPATEWIIGAGYGRGGADQSTMLDPDDFPEVTEKSMRGLLRDAVESLVKWHPTIAGPRCQGSDEEARKYCGPSEACPVCRICGSVLRRSGWHVSSARLATRKRNLICAVEEAMGGGRDLRGSLVDRRTRVAINAELGRAAQHKLFEFETAAAGLALEGFVEERPPLALSGSARARDALVICAGLRLIERLGGHRRKGWGQVKVRPLTIKPRIPGFPDNLPDFVKAALAAPVMEDQP